MTALTMSARSGPGAEASPRPVPWRQMAWVAWRQHRTAVGAVVLLLGAWAVYLWVNGLSMHRAYAAVTACRPVSSSLCQQLVFAFNGNWSSPAAFNLSQAAPALIGAFVGAPVLARELETGTFRYAWTQGIGRWRWTLAKLVPLAIAVAAAAGACSALFSWYYQPLIADGAQTPLAPEVFDLRGGITFAAWTLAAFAIGVLAGMLTRRVVPAMAATLAVYAGLAFAAATVLRRNYLTPLATKNPNLPSSDWITGQQWHAKGGQPVSQSAVERLMLKAPEVTLPGGLTKPLNPVAYLEQHGYTLWTTYQPASRFWPFQWIEGGWLLALSVLLIAATVWLVRRRAT